MERIGRLPAPLLLCLATSITALLSSAPSFGQPNLELVDSSVNLTAGQTFAAGSNFTISWQVTNSGDAASNAWVDAIYITNDNPAQLPAEAIPIVSTFELFGLGVGGVLNGPGDYDSVNYAGCGTFRWPTSLAPGEYYVAFAVDATNLVFESNEDNLVYIGPINLTAASPTVDLTIDPASINLTPVLPTYAPGQGFNLTWNVDNLGAQICNSDFALNWIDKVYATPTQIPGVVPPGSVEMYSGLQTGPLPANGSYNGPADLDGTFLCGTVACWPPVAGEYWLLFVLDEANDLFEGTIGESNNFVYFGPFSIESDSNLSMVPGSISIGSSIVTAGDVVSISYDVENNGGEAITLPWTEVVMLTSDGAPTLQTVPGVSSVVATFDETVALTSGQVRSRNLSFCIPQDDAFGGGNYVVGVYVDGLPEGTLGGLFAIPEATEADNWESGPSLTVTLAAQPDLQATVPPLPQFEYLTGSLFTINYTVSNQGSAATDANTGTVSTDSCGNPLFSQSTWSERIVFLPAGTVVTPGECPPGDLEITVPTTTQAPLTPGMSLSRSASGLIPAGFTGGLFDAWLCLDSTDVVSEGCAGCEGNNTILLGLVNINAGNPIVQFRRGDCNSAGGVNLTDGTDLLFYLFANGATPPCLDACDFDGSGNLNLVDSINLLQYLFAGGAPPAPPGANNCGVTAAMLGCDLYNNCP